MFDSVMLSVFALLAITNPFGILPVFISMTDDLTESQRKRLFRQIVYTSAIIMVIFAIIGTFIMGYFFQVEISQLKIAGGILLVVMGAKNLLFPEEGKSRDINEYPAASGIASQRLVPMAFPLLVGPGALTTVIIIRNESGMTITMTAIAITFAAIMILFMLTKYIERLLGKLVMSVVSRIMQVFIMTIGVKMLVQGIKDIFFI